VDVVCNLQNEDTPVDQHASHAQSPRSWLAPHHYAVLADVK
jgi:hypothetical protein